MEIVVLVGGTVIMVFIAILVIIMVASNNKLRRDIMRQHEFFTGRMDEIEGIVLNEFKNVLNQLKK